MLRIRKKFVDIQEEEFEFAGGTVMITMDNFDSPSFSQIEVSPESKVITFLYFGCVRFILEDRSKFAFAWSGKGCY